MSVRGYEARETLNLIVGVECVEQFVVAKWRWQIFLQELSEKDLTEKINSQYSQRPEASTHSHVRPIQENT
jgi:hypothetical protein